MSPGNLISIVTRIQIRRPRNRSSVPSVGRVVSFSAAPRPAMESSQSPIQCGWRDIFSGVRRPGPEAHHLSASSSDIKNV